MLGRKNLELLPSLRLKGIIPVLELKQLPSKQLNREKAPPHDLTSTPETNDGTHQINDAIWKKREKSLPSKISENDDCTDGHRGECQKAEGKLLKPPECTSSSSDNRKESNDSAPSTLKVISPNKLNLPTKVSSRRKLNMPKPFMEKYIKSVKSIGNGHFHDNALILKEKLSYCLSCYQVRKWCVFEWFYNAIDYPWFAKREFVSTWIMWDWAIFQD